MKMKRREFISKSALIGLSPRIDLRNTFHDLYEVENGNTYPNHISFNLLLFRLYWKDTRSFLEERKNIPIGITLILT
jgi:hypothetical protein